MLSKSATLKYADKPGNSARVVHSLLWQRPLCWDACVLAVICALTCWSWTGFRRINAGTAQHALPRPVESFATTYVEWESRRCFIQKCVLLVYNLRRAFVIYSN